MRNLKVFTLINALLYAGMGMGSPLISLQLAALGASYTTIATIAVSVTLTILLTSYLWGFLSDRLLMHKPFLSAGLALQSLGTAVLAFSVALPMAWAGQLIGGLGMAAYHTVSLAMLGAALAQSTQRGKEIGWWRGVGALAFAVCATLGGWLADRAGLQASLLVSAGLYLAGALVALFFLAESEETQKIAGNRQRAPVMPMAPDLAIGAPPTGGGWLPFSFLSGVFLFAGAQAAASALWPNYLQEIGYSKAAIGAAWGLTAAIEFPIMYYSGTIADRMGRRALLAAGALLMALAQLGYSTLAHFVPWLIGIQVLRGLGYGSYTANALALTAELSNRQERGATSGQFNSVSSVGALLGMIVAGQLAQQAGFGILYLLCALLSFAAAFSFFWEHTHHKRAALQEKIDQLRE